MSRQRLTEDRKGKVIVFNQKELRVKPWFFFLTKFLKITFNLRIAFLFLRLNF